MKDKLAHRLGRVGFRLMHDSDQHEVIVIREGQVEKAVGELELDTLYRFHCLGAEARAQALRLTSNREQFILREYVSQQVHAECATLDDVAEAIEKRKADQSERVVRLRELAQGRSLVERRPDDNWSDYAARARKEEQRLGIERPEEHQPVYSCARISCMRAALMPQSRYCAEHVG